MNILFQKVTIVDPSSPYNGKTMDVLVKRGKIQSIGKKIEAEGIKTVSIKGAHLSPGWLDIGTQIGEPGFEYREDIESISQVAMSGGYTALAPFPNLHPVVDSQSLITFITNKAQASPIDIFPIGAVSKGTKGHEMAELVDMHEAGAVGFSDGAKPIDNEGLLVRALQYVRRFDGLIIDQPINSVLTLEAQVHEGLSSTMMGLKGHPTASEVARIKRNIEIANYSESRLLLHLISTKEGLDVFKEAAKDNDRLRASVGVFNLCHTEDDILEFDNQLKLLPPLRPLKDRNALVRGIQKGHIQIICSQHIPLEDEMKEMAFYDAEPGAISLQLSFAMLISSLGDEVNLETLIGCLCHNPRRILGLEIPSIIEENPFNATLFHPNRTWTFTKEDNRSKSRNTSAFDRTFKGSVIGTFNKSQAYWNIPS